MEIIDLEMIPGGPKKTCHASQFDNGRVIRFNLKENGQPFALSGTETVQAIIRKPDGSETTLDIANTSSTYVDLITEEDTCDLAGVNHCEMKVTEDGEDLGSGNFDMKVEEDAYGEADVTVGEASGEIASFETDIKDNLVECVCEINPVQDLHGYDHPWPAGGGRNLLGINSRVSQTTANVVYTSDKEYIYLNGTKNGGGYADMTNLILSLEAGTYYLKAFIISGTASNTVSLYAFDGSDNITPDLLGGERALTLPEPKTFRFRFAVWADGTILNNYKIGVVVSKTSNIDKFYTYENVCPIEGHTEMDIIRSGVNIWNEEWKIITQSGRDWLTNKNPIPVQPNHTYYIKTPFNASIDNVSATGSYISYIGQKGNEAFTTPSNCHYIRFLVDTNNYGTTYNNDISINYPSTDTTYHPAEIIKKNIQLGQTVYRARINITTGRMTIVGKQIILNGTQTLNASSFSGTENNAVARFVLTDASETYGGDDTPSALCETLKPVECSSASNFAGWGGDANRVNSFTIHTSGNYIAIALKNPAITNNTTLTTYLQNNPITFVYTLANRVSIQLTPEQIETLLGQQNNVYHTANGDTAVKFYTRA